MGSSPVTATIDLSRPGPALAAAAAAVAQRLPPGEGAVPDTVLVAFSGGPDSTALLLAVACLAARGGVRAAAAHLDHGLDAGSGARAEAARAIAARIGVPCAVARWDGGPAAGESREAVARRARYAFLEERRREIGARWLATGHHRDDQVETVLLRLLYGSGVAGLAGIADGRGPLLRPLLGLPRRRLAAAVAECGLETVADPTNDELGVPRNRVRHLLAPRLADADRERLLAVAAAAGGARRRLERCLRPLLSDGLAGPSLDLEDLRRLPPELLPWALALLHRRRGAEHPAPRTATAELSRQLAAGGRVACDAGGGWRWRSRGPGLHLEPAPLPAVPFAYTVRVPGVVTVPEIGATVRLRQAPPAPWMWRGSPARAGLDLPLAPGGVAVVRSRRPGDRLQPLGCTFQRRLKEVLIDRKVPRRDRDALPLLIVGGQVAWVPGVTVHDPFRVRPGRGAVWIAEIEPSGPAETEP